MDNALLLGGTIVFDLPLLRLSEVILKKLNTLIFVFGPIKFFIVKCLIALIYIVLLIDSTQAIVMIS